jgi:hypothetical protein
MTGGRFAISMLDSDALGSRTTGACVTDHCVAEPDLESLTY